MIISKGYDRNWVPGAIFICKFIPSIATSLEVTDKISNKNIML